ncbi:MAG: sigma-70 family RNA polymerase sigma factor [Myxococcales bacterium]|nr:sigma-70 family RNA polymerase sigma factor [Myxococcales bacterium]
MPLARGLSVSADGARASVRLPGFGWLVPAGTDGFAYVCDALAGVEPGVEDVPWVVLEDGTMLIGTPRGLRRLDPGGYPQTERPQGLGSRPIAALSLDASAPGRVYALGASGPTSEQGVYYSEDRGLHWQRRGTLPTQGRVTALAVGSEAGDTLYVGQSTGVGQSALLWSLDGGRSFEVASQRGLWTPIHVLTASNGLIALVEQGGVGATLMRIDEPGGAAQRVLEINFFGGFAKQGQGLWAGDEGGGLFRSTNAGESFRQVRRDVAPACLVGAQGALWACTPGLPDQPAVARVLSVDPAEPFEPIVALSEVRALVNCDPSVMVETLCGAAWREWRADVLSVAEATPGHVPPAVASSGLSQVDVDAGVDEDQTTSRTATGSGASSDTSAGCNLSPSPAGADPCSLVGLLVFVLLAGRARTRDGLGYAAMSKTRSRPASETATPASMAGEDSSLIARAQNGDVDAFGEIYDRHAPVLSAVAHRMLGGDAEDLLQDVFVEAWRKVRSYDPGRASVRTWLLVRLRSRALDRMGRQGREAAAVALLASGAPASPARSQMDDRVDVRRRLSGLARDVQLTLELTYYAGMSAKEVARHMQVPEGTVRSRLARGQRQLAGQLGGQQAQAEQQAAHQEVGKGKP